MTNHHKPEPVAWMYEPASARPTDPVCVTARSEPLGAKSVTPLYSASALDEAYRRGQEAARDDDGELLTIAWMDGSHRSTEAHRERIMALEAERDRLRAIMPHYDRLILAVAEFGPHSGFFDWMLDAKEARAALEASDGAD